MPELNPINSEFDVEISALEISTTDPLVLVSTKPDGALTFKIREIEKKANKKTEKENTLKLYNTLLNSLSHELRTPISTIIGVTDTLQEEKNKLSEENKTELISEISKASLRLNRQVGNLRKLQ